MCKDCNRLKECRAEFKKMGFWTFNKGVKIWSVFGPEWSNKNRVFSMEVAV